MGVSYISDQVCAVCNTTNKRFIILSEPILKFNLLILKTHHSCTEGTVSSSTLRMKKNKNESGEKNPRGRLAEEEEGGGGGEMIKCSTKHCGSCCGGYVADCVAVCCCPCAVLHCCALAIVKGPSLVGRKCLGLGKKNKIKNKNKKKGHGDDVVVVLERNNIEKLQRGVSVREMDTGVTLNAGFDAEKVWKELYQIGHMDFGRVSSSSHDGSSLGVTEKLCLDDQCSWLPI